MTDEQRTHAAQIEAQGNDNANGLAAVQRVVAARDRLAEEYRDLRTIAADEKAEPDDRHFACITADDMVREQPTMRERFDAIDREQAEEQAGRIASAVQSILPEEGKPFPNAPTVERIVRGAGIGERLAEFAGDVFSGVASTIEEELGRSVNAGDVVNTADALMQCWREGERHWEPAAAFALDNLDYLQEPRADPELWAETAAIGQAEAIGIAQYEAAERVQISPKAAAAIQQLATIIPAVDREPSEGDVTRHMMTGEEPRSWTLDDLKRDRADSGEKAAGQQAAAMRDASAARRDAQRRDYDLER